MKKISVIIPVYNTEKYLKQCVDSVQNQDYKNLEIILIDDGSQDTSPEICDNYAKSDGRIRVIHQENGGLSNARNVGIEHCTGDYILFLDSDDYWDNRFFVDKLVAMVQAKPVEILNFRYKKFLEEEEKFVSCLNSFHEISDTEKEQVLEKMIDQGLYISSACNKMLSASFLKSNQLLFRKGITSEDIDWCARIMIQCKTIGYINEDAYVYRQRSSSISHSLTYKNIFDLSNNIKECVKLGRTIPKSTKFYDLYHNFVAYQYGTLLLSNNFVDDRKVREIMADMKEYQWLLKYHRNGKIKLQYFINFILGYKNLIRLLKAYSTFRRY